MSFQTRAPIASRMIEMVGIISATARPAVMNTTLGKRARDTGNEDDFMLSTRSKRIMTGPPSMPRASTLGRRTGWDIDRQSARHQIFKTRNVSTSPSARGTRWMEEIEAFFNPSFSPQRRSANETLTGTQSEVPSMESRPIRRAVSPRSAASKFQSYYAALEAFREERREGAYVDRRAMVEDHFPQIGEEDIEFIGLDRQSSPESNAARTTSNNRVTEGALDEPMLDVPEDINTSNIEANQQRSHGDTSSSTSTSTTHSSSTRRGISGTLSARHASSGSPSARRPSSSSSSVKKLKRKSSPNKDNLSGLELSPTLKEIERMEMKLRRPSPKGARVIKPGQMMDRADRSKEALTDMLHTCLAGLPATKLERKIDWTAEKLKSMKLEDLINRGVEISGIYM
ncbi:MAG: hypothetical protein Q9204_001118 [Flavoplaca sp. TL-2023a]